MFQPFEATLTEIRKNGNSETAEEEADEVLDKLLSLRDRKGRTVVHHVKGFSCSLIKTTCSYNYDKDNG